MPGSLPNIVFKKHGAKATHNHKIQPRPHSLIPIGRMNELVDILNERLLPEIFSKFNPRNRLRWHAYVSGYKDLRIMLIFGAISPVPKNKHLISNLTEKHSDWATTKINPVLKPKRLIIAKTWTEDNQLYLLIVPMTSKGKAMKPLPPLFILPTQKKKLKDEVEADAQAETDPSEHLE